MQDQITMLVLLAMGLGGMWWGFGKLTGLWGEQKKEGGMTAQKFIAISVISVIGLMWLSAPGSDQVMAGTFEAARVNFILGIQPLIRFATELGAAAGIIYVIYLVVRRRLRR